ncbi:MAG: zinc ribbon domain-containing protein [Lachnospiraceae bacterium]|nr:zinc ribbon domain-containing protein [Lachnospiraceae bacterium]
MRCQNCGRELKNGARFCIACGAQHDENGQLVGSGNQINSQLGNQGSIDYNKTMMMGNTGFKQYSEADNVQNFQQYDYNYANVNMENGENIQNATAKKKISPILIICPLIIVVALLVSLIGGKTKKTTKKVGSSQNETAIVKEENIETKEPVKETSVIATVSIATQSEQKEKIHLSGYWSADADYFYIDGEMQKNLWVEDYYVGSDGRKVTNDWIDNKYYVDATGKKARNEWIEFSFYGEDGQKKSGFYYVD